MILNVITYPDKRLKMVSEEVKSFDSALHTLLDDMYETMLISNGIGLAAIQVAVPKRVLLLSIPDEEGAQLKEDLIEMINPVITHAEGKTLHQEGCLSVPGFYEDVERYANVTVSYQDRNAQTHTLEADELLSIAIQHEMDHLDGKLFIEKLSYIRRKKFEKEYKKAQKSAQKK